MLKGTFIFQPSIFRRIYQFSGVWWVCWFFVVSSWWPVSGSSLIDDSACWYPLYRDNSKARLDYRPDYLTTYMYRPVSVRYLMSVLSTFQLIHLEKIHPGSFTESQIWNGSTPLKLTCPLNSDHFSRNYIFQPSIFRGHVSFQGSSKFLDSRPSLHPIGSMERRYIYLHGWLIFFGKCW